jgi:hypothetical protein
VILFPDWFPSITAMVDQFQPIYRVRLEHNEVAGAPLMVVYETRWNRWRGDRQPCPGALAGAPWPVDEAPGKMRSDRIIASWHH